jgi:MFS family permease
VNAQVQQNIGLLLKESAYSNSFVILTGGAFLTGLALHFGANDFELGLLASAPFLMQGAQLLSPFLFKPNETGKQKVVATIASSRYLWIMLVPLLLLSTSFGLPFLIGVTFLSGFLAMISSPAWLTTIVSLVPEDRLGKTFGRRNAAIAISTLIVTTIGSLILDWSKADGTGSLGFSAILIGAAIATFFATQVMKKIPATIETGSHESIKLSDITAPLKDTRFRPILIVFSAWNAAIGISAAFFAPHMLVNLKMSFFQIGMYSCVAAIVGISSSYLWGKLIDRFGSRPILALCAFGIALIPLVWVFPTADFRWILIPEVIYSGLFWSGFNVAAFTLPIDRSPKSERTAYLAMFATVTGVAFFAASLAAGYAAEAMAGMSFAWGNLDIINYHVLFIVSALVRLVAAALMSAIRQPEETSLPIIVQFIGYAVLKRMSIGRQILPLGTTSKKEPREV